MNDRAISAEEALKAGFVNQILHDINPKEEYIDLMKIPCIPKLLSNNVETMVTAKRLLNQGQNREAMLDIFIREADALYTIWISKEFPRKMMIYLLSLNQRP